MGSTRSNEEVKPLEKPFNKRRWAETLFTTPNKPTGAVAMGFLLFMRMDAKGEGAAISDAEFMAKCTVSDKACRNFKGWLVKHGFLKIKVRGYRGYTSQYAALIPECNTGIDDDEYRNAIPEQTASVPELDTGIRPPSKEKSPPTPLKENTLLQASKQQDAARELAGLNGSTEPMIVDVMAWMTGGGDRQLATNWLTTFLRQYPQEAVRQAYFDLKTDLANGRLVANKLRVWGLKAAAFKSHASNGADKQKPSPFANFGKRYTEPLKR